MSTHIEPLHSTGLGGFGGSAAADAETAGREAVRSALAGRVPGAHVADAFVAMTLDRPYRRALPRDQAIDELLRHRGTQFDAAVVDALLAREHPEALPAAA